MNKYQSIDINKAKYFTITTKIVIIFAIISTMVTFIQRDKSPNGYENMWLLPLSYGILFYCTKIRQTFFKYIGISILNLILFVRYLILPIFSSLTGLYFHSFAIRTDGYVNSLSILLMIYEMICIFLVLHYAIKRLDRQQIKMYNDIKLVCDTNFGVYKVAILIGIVSFLYIPEIQERTNFLLVNDFQYNNLNAISYVGFLFTTNALKVFFLFILSIRYEKRRKGYKKNQFLILFFAFLNISVFWSTNRLTIVAQGLATIAILKASNMINRKLSYILITITILIVLSLSSYRWFGYGKLNTFYDDSGYYFDDNQMTSNYLQAYFGGPHLISTAINTKEKQSFGTKLEAFPNEIFSSILFVRQLIPLSENSSTKSFNKKFGFSESTSMILPTLGQSYMYFGIFGAPLLSVIFCLFLYKAEKAIIKCKNIGERYAYYILVIWLAFFPMQNLNIVSASFFNVFLPFYLIVVANKRFKIG